MAKTSVENAVCEKCGVDVRENTTFCYNCGKPVVDISVEDEVKTNGEKHADENAKSALEDLAARLKIDEEADNKLAKAAAQRRKARVSQRKPREVVWESSESTSGGLLVGGALIVTVIAGLVVFLTIFYR